MRMKFVKLLIELLTESCFTKVGVNVSEKLYSSLDLRAYTYMYV